LSVDEVVSFSPEVEMRKLLNEKDQVSDIAMDSLVTLFWKLQNSLVVIPWIYVNTFGAQLHTRAPSISI